MQGVRCPAVEVDGGVTGLYYTLTILTMAMRPWGYTYDGYAYYGYTVY
jgi:hypothetical protein